MARYQVKDPQGQMHVIEGPEGATPDQVLAQAQMLIPTEMPKGSYWGDVGRSAIREGKEFVAGAPDTAQTVLALTKPLTGQLPTQGDLARIKGLFSGIPEMASSAVEETARSVSHPIQSFRNSPIATTATLASLAIPVAKGARAIFSGRAVPAVANAAVSQPGIGRRLFAKSMNVALGVPEEGVLARLENPAAVKTAFSHPELADQMVGSMKNLQETIKELSTKARGALRTSSYLDDGAVTKDAINDAIRLSRRSLGGVFGQEAKTAARALENVKGFYKKLRNTVSESQVRDLVDQLDEEIPWDKIPQEWTATDNALANLRGRLDGMIKAQNPSYAEAMKPVEEAIGTRNAMQKTFSIQKIPKRGFQPTDATVGKIQSVFKENKLQSQDTLKRFRSFTGEDYQTKIANANANKMFTGERTQGSRRAVAGAAVGTLAGYMTGLPPAVTGPLGTAAGIFADIYGKAAAGKIVDALASPRFAKYATTLKDAASGGTKNLIKVQSALVQKDPEYAAIINASGTKRKTITPEKAKEFMKKAKGNRELARQLAKLENFIGFSGDGIGE